MNKIISLTLVVFAVMLLSTSVMAQGNNNNNPFNQLWDEVANLWDAINDIELTPGPQGPAGNDGTNGKDGINGTDGTNGTNGNDGADGTPGINGTDGADGQDGVNGTDGTNGADGLNCWDLNADFVCDLNEDVNEDTFCNALDCQGPQGEQGSQGETGPQGPAGDVNSSSVGGGQSHTNMQPYNTINYIVALQGVFPSRESGPASDVMIGEIRMFGGNFAPGGYAFADGQLLQIAQYSALFSIYGTTYGGDGRTTFALPDLRGRAPVHEGNGPGLTSRTLGERGGVEDVTLTTAQMPNHDHN